VVHEDAQGEGWGRTIVKVLISQARLRRVPTLFALTRAVPFFQKLGFAVSAMERFPEKVFRDCLICPVRNHCDETAVVMRLQ
jgi:amino-acid N-acetyltransferase